MDEREYCQALEGEVLAIYQQMLMVGRDRLSEVVPGPVDVLIKELMDDAGELVKETPYIGGDDNPFTPNLACAVPVLSFFKVLERRGIDCATSGKLSIELTRLSYERVPPEQNLATKFFERFSSGDIMVRWEPVSRQHRYPGDFEYAMVWGKGEGGADFLQCAILKFFKARGMEAYVPYLCAQDAIVSEISNQGLQRTTTLAEGGSRCDFRYRPGAGTNVKSSVWP